MGPTVSLIESYSVVSCVAVGVTLLLLSLIDMWKLKFDLALYCIMAGVGSFTLAVVIKKACVTQSVVLDTSTEKKHWKPEQLHHSRLCPEKGSTDPLDSFSLPRCIRVMVSNYQLLQAIFAMPKGECHVRDIRPDEQFSPTVTIVDAGTQQPLNCVLLLHGEKHPEVSCRILFYYIAVQVMDGPHYDDEHGSHTYPLYHMESKPCKQGRLPLIFCFHQPGTVCVIQLSIHSIVDSEGVEYMYHSEDFTCIVQIIDRKQHQYHSRDQHGVLRMKEPSRIKYTGPLATKQFHKLERVFTKLFLSACYKEMMKLKKRIIVENSISADIKVFAQCWEAVAVSVHENLERTVQLLKTAWKNASKLECENGLLLQGRVLRHLAHFQYVQGNDDKALEYMSWAKERFFNAVPSNETALTLYTELRMKRRTLFSKNRPFSSELYASVEKDYELLLMHAKDMEEYEQPVICNFFTMKASFHLRSDLITDKLPPEEYWPSPDDLLKAEECLNSVPLNKMPSLNNYYIIRYYCTLSDLHIWKKLYPEAMHYLEEARELHDQIKLNASTHYAMRLKLINRLKRDDKIDEILKEFADLL